MGFRRACTQDQGGTFESAVIQELCRLLGTKKSRTTSYAPWANGVTERMNLLYLFPVSDLPSPDHNDLELERSTTTQKKKRVQPNTRKDTPELDSSSDEDEFTGYGEVVEVFVLPAPQPVQPPLKPGDQTVLEENSIEGKNSEEGSSVEDKKLWGGKQCGG